MNNRFAAVQINDHSLAMEGTPKAHFVSATQTRGANDRASAVKRSFIPYLPQDDAAVAGLGEQAGGVDASKTQEVVDYLNERLKALLRLPPLQFWNIVVTDETLTVFLDSYLRFKGRWFDNPLGNLEGRKGNVVTGDGDLCRRTFMALFRISSNHDPESPGQEGLFAKNHPAMSLQRKLLDIPKLMDICAIYGHDNFDLTQRLVSNVFEAQPGHYKELVAYIRPMVERIITLHQRCCSTVEAIDAQTAANGRTRVHEELLEVVNYLNDLVITLKAFVKAYPPAASSLVSSGSSVSGQGLLLPVLAAMHDSMLPVLRDGIARLGGSLEIKQACTLTKNGSQHVELKVSAEDQLCQIGESLVDLCWHLIEHHYLSDYPSEMSMSGTDEFTKSYQDADWKGDSLVQSIILLATGPCNRDDHLAKELTSNRTSLNCTGAMLQSLNKFYGLFHGIHSACQRGTLVLNEAQKDYLSGLMTTLKISDGNNSTLPMITLPEIDSDEKAIILQSKISQVKDLFPELGDGYIAVCLEAYDNDPERVIERILNGTLHSDLLLLDTALVTKPNIMGSHVEGKGKGKLDEQMGSSKSKTISGDRSPPLEEFGSSSSFEGTSGGASGHSKRIHFEEESMSRSDAKIGRYMRRPQESATFSNLLDSLKEDKRSQAFTRAAAAQIEYEDEYDDSFDELGGFVADVGGVEETQNLVDQVGRRDGIRDQSIGVRINNRPVVPTPWGSSTAKSSNHSTSTQKSRSEVQKFSAVVPEEDQVDVNQRAGQVQLAHSVKGKERQKSFVAVPEVNSQAHSFPPKANLPAGLGLGSHAGPRREGQKTSTLESEFKGQTNDTKPTDLPAGPGSGASGGRGRKKWKEQGPKPQFYLKDGKIYSYKVAGAVGISSVEEAEAIKQDEGERIHGLGAGGNFPMHEQDNSASDQKIAGHDQNLKHGQSGNLKYPDSFGEGGRGHGRRNRGRGDSGQGQYVKKDNDNHHRKDNAMKKHFAGLGGF